MKIQLAITICCCLFLVFPKRGLSQSEDRVYRKFTTIQMQRALEKQDPNVVTARQEIERFTDSIQAFLTPTPRTLPVVFHIFNKEAGKELVSERDVNAQIQALNRDFNNLDYAERHSADTREGFNQLVADMEISFCLAHLKVGRSGFHYIDRPNREWVADNSLKDPNKGGIAPWYPDQVINIWVADLSDGVSGFAQMPGGPPATDGIVIDYRFFGTGAHAEETYRQGKTLTHLMGNYLNLYDLWGGYGKCSDDGVEDTPIHNAPNYGIPPYKHISTCNSGRRNGSLSVEMTMNFMDNTDDKGQYMFTHGQKARVHALFYEGSAREKLTQSNFLNCPTQTSSTSTDRNTLVNTLSPSNEVKIYPNPTHAHLYVGLNSEQKESVKIQIMNAMGSKVYDELHTYQKGYQEHTIRCDKWAAGIYYIQVGQEDQMTTHQVTILNNLPTQSN